MRPKTRAGVGLLGFLVAGLALGGVPSSAQLRTPRAELTPAVQQQATPPGQTVAVQLRVELPEDIHVQSDNPREDYLIPTVLTFAPPSGVTVEGVEYPVATDWFLEGQEEPLAVFGDEFTIEARLALATNVSPGELVVPGLFQYQACDDRVCFPPATEAVEWRVQVGPANVGGRP